MCELNFYCGIKTPNLLYMSIKMNIAFQINDMNFICHMIEQKLDLVMKDFAIQKTK